MEKYLVSLQVNMNKNILINAESEKDAEKKVKQLYNDNLIDFSKEDIKFTEFYGDQYGIYNEEHHIDEDFTKKLPTKKRKLFSIFKKK